MPILAQQEKNAKKRKDSLLLLMIKAATALPQATAINIHKQAACKIFCRPLKRLLKKSLAWRFQCYGRLYD